VSSATRSLAPCPDPAALFRVLNSFFEPAIRAGWAVPDIVPTRLIVLETRGRRSGRRVRVPLLAARFGGHWLVSTFRGPRSQWIRNAAADGNVRFWLDGKAKPARALVFRAGARAVSERSVPASIRTLAGSLMPATRFGWAFAFLLPRTRATKRVRAARKKAGR
jgi:hypothetical protein